MQPAGPPVDPVARLVPMLEDAAILLGLYDPDDRLIHANRAFRDSFFVESGETPTFEQIIRRNHAAGRGTQIDTDDIDGWMVSTLARRGKTPVRRIESHLLDGRWLQMTHTVTPDGWTLVIGSDITGVGIDHRDLRQAHDAAVKGALTDTLTHLPNRRSMEDTLDRFVHGSLDRPVCAALFDIDFFKAVNDSLGHAAGDAVLIQFARTVQRMIRPHDSFGRVGGEEFLLVLPDRTLDAAVAAVDDLRSAVRTQRVRCGHTDVRVTASAGVTQIVTGDTGSAVLGRCDGALYRAKSDGRDLTRAT